MSSDRGIVATKLGPTTNLPAMGTFEWVYNRPVDGSPIEIRCDGQTTGRLGHCQIFNYGLEGLVPAGFSYRRFERFSQLTQEFPLSVGANRPMRKLSSMIDSLSAGELVGNPSAASSLECHR